MERRELIFLKQWCDRGPGPNRKPLVLRGARQVGKSYLVRDFCQREGITCFEINFEKEPSLRKFFVEGANSKTLSILEAHFGAPLTNGLLFLDEIQAAPEVFARLRYFYEESPEIPVIATGSLLEFALSELEHSVPVGRIEYLHMGPMSFEEFLLAQGQKALHKALTAWTVATAEKNLIDPFHEKLLDYARDYSVVGGMPEAINHFLLGRDFRAVEAAQSAILETYVQDFSKYRKRIPQERMERIFKLIPSNVGRKWVHARVNPDEKAQATDAALTALCKARVAHRVFHSAGNGVPLGAEKKENLSKILFLDVGLMSAQLGLRISDFIDASQIENIGSGTIAEQWVGQHLLDARPFYTAPELYYWVREKSGALAEVDYLMARGPKVCPVEVKAGPSVRAKSLQVFMKEKNAALGVHFSTQKPGYDEKQKILRLPLYMAGQAGRIIDEFISKRV